jgi:hypothetical protein
MKTIKFTANVSFDPVTNQITNWSDRKVTLNDEILYEDGTHGNATDSISPVENQPVPPVENQPVPPVETQPELPPDQPEDCRDSTLFFENRADGDCLFDSIAQIYYPVDYRNLDEWAKKKFTDEVQHIVSRLRHILSRYYRLKARAATSDNDKKRMYDRSQYIFEDKTWGDDRDLEILVNLLGIHNVKIIRNGNVSDNAMVNSSDSVKTGYTFCNISNNAGTPVHWVLKKGGIKRDFNEDSTNAWAKTETPIPVSSGGSIRKFSNSLGKNKTRRILFSAT